jgi:hypothetical protein
MGDLGRTAGLPELERELEATENKALESQDSPAEDRTEELQVP